MNHFFQFEADFVDSLRCIPMEVRYKLDISGIKLKLHQWNRFTQEERKVLVVMPCITDAQIAAYREFVRSSIKERTGEEATDLPIDPNPPWLSLAKIPESVLEKAREVGVTILPQQWASLDVLQRFALVKLSLSHHEGKNFLPAFEEFGLSGNESSSI